MTNQTDNTLCTLASSDCVYGQKLFCENKKLMMSTLSKLNLHSYFDFGHKMTYFLSNFEYD